MRKSYRKEVQTYSTPEGKKAKQVKRKASIDADRNRFDSRHKASRGNVTQMALAEYFTEYCTAR